MPYGGRTQRSQRVCSRRRTSTAEIWDGPSSAALVAHEFAMAGRRNRILAKIARRRSI
jgi:hypothetical protein